MRKAILALLVCLTVGATLPENIHALTRAGKVLSVRKEVYILREAEKKEATPQAPLFMEDTVETGKDSGAKLYFIDDSVLNLSEMSRLVVKEYLYNSEKGRSKAIYKLLRGALRVFVGNSELEIHTPTALASVRGTRFIIWIEGSEEALTTFVHVIEGEVELRNIKGGPIVVIQKGESSIIKGPNPPRLIRGIITSKLRPIIKGTAVVGKVSIRKKPPKLLKPLRPRHISKRLKRHLWQRPPVELTRVGIKILFPR